MTQEDQSSSVGEFKMLVNDLEEGDNQEGAVDVDPNPPVHIAVRVHDAVLIPPEPEFIDLRQSLDEQLRCAVSALACEWEAYCSFLLSDLANFDVLNRLHQQLIFEAADGVLDSVQLVLDSQLRAEPPDDNVDDLHAILSAVEQKLREVFD